MSEYKKTSLVNDNLELIPSCKTGKLNNSVRKIIKNQALEKLGKRDPFLRHIMDIKVVCNERRNFVNVIVRREYTTLCHKDTLGKLQFCYMYSDKLEPYVIVVVLHPQYGRLKQLSTLQIDDLEKSLSSFRHKFGLQDEKYHYTCLSERKNTDKFVGGSGCNSSSKAHSSHFHLKILIPSAMYNRNFQVCELFNLGTLVSTIEPIKYNFSRECTNYDDTIKLLRGDAFGH